MVNPHLDARFLSDGVVGAGAVLTLMLWSFSCLLPDNEAYPSILNPSEKHACIDSPLFLCFFSDPFFSQSFPSLPLLSLHLSRFQARRICWRSAKSRMGMDGMGV